MNFLAISIPRRCVDVYQNQGYCIVARSTKLKATSTSKESTIKVHLLPSSEIAGRETAPREADNGTRSSSSSSSSAKQDLLTAAATVAVDLLPLDKNSEATARRRVKSMESQIFAQLLWKRCNEELREEDAIPAGKYILRVFPPTKTFLKSCRKTTARVVLASRVWSSFIMKTAL